MTQVEEKYNLLIATFDVNCPEWKIVHTKYTPFMFCIANRKAIIAEYLIWEEFVKGAKAINFEYDPLIDSFLNEYKKTVYACLKNVD